MTEVPKIPATLWIDGVEVVFCALDDDGEIALQAAQAWLAPDERARAQRIRFARDRDRFIRGRGFLRRELARRVGFSPEDVRFVAGPMGKPSLADPELGAPGSAGRWHFSLSHAEGLAALGLSRGAEVGLDIEMAGRRPGGADGPDALIELCFGDEEARAIRAAPDPDGCFLRFWTAKEARMKLTGEGMALSPRSIALVLKDGHAVGYAAPPTPLVILTSFVAHGAVGCIAKMVAGP